MIVPVASVTVVIPVGPSHGREFVRDTIDSARESLPDCRLILIDDSGDDTIRHLAPADATIIAAPAGYEGLEGQLYRRLSLAFREALRTPFDLLLRLDTDALILGNTFVPRATHIFAENPRIGALGCYRTNYDGTPRTYTWPALRIRRMVTVEALRDPMRALRVGRLLLRAYHDGDYIRGESVQGGAMIYSPAAIRSFAQTGLLDDRRLARSRMQEDHIFGLCLRGLGYRMLDFGSANDDLPFAITWRGLPSPPEQLIAAGKEIVHSTKSFGDCEEREIRSVFLEARRTRRAAAN